MASPTGVDIDLGPAPSPEELARIGTRVGRIPTFFYGHPVFAELAPEEMRSQHQVHCAMTLHLQLGPGQYATYGLVGGP